MYFDSFAELIEMGKHGPYVWSAYACFVVVVAGNIFAAISKRKKVKAEIERAIRREEKQV